MSLVDEVYRLRQDQVKLACDTMLEASIVREMGGKWREVFRVMKHKQPVGRMKRIFAILEKLDADSIEQVSKSLSEVKL